MKRREFIKIMAGGIASIIGGEGIMKNVAASQIQSISGGRKSKVSLVKTSDRSSGIKRAIELLEINPIKGKDVLLKPNFNTADPFPASTHNDTLINLIQHLKKMGASKITIGERSGPPVTATVLNGKGIHELCKKLDVDIINFEELPSESWIKVKPAMSHWNDGFFVAKPVLDSECIVSTCCLKTHGYGGVFTMSLKLSVGVTNKSNMRELHSSSPDMRKMIAEINQAYKPSLILLDGIEAFTDGGPSRGTKKRGDVILAGTDRIAIDAVGVAILKELGSNNAIMGKNIFEQEQISRAVELGLGIKKPEDIEIIADDNDSKKYAEKLVSILLKN